MDNTKQCPYCAEEIKARAVICKYCHNNLGGGAVGRDGQYLSVRIKTCDKVYAGDVFVPPHLCRVSDVLNDSRHFVLLANAKEETRTAKVPIGTLALNKSIIEWIRFVGPGA